MKPYYEGWYMKQQQGDQVISFIAGCVPSEAFIQIVTTTGAHYISFPLSSYSHEKRPRTLGTPRQTAELEQTLRIGNNIFSPQGVKISIHEQGFDLEALLTYSYPTPLKAAAMGPFNLIPLETKHTIFSMRHAVDGFVTINNTTTVFTNGTGYMEGDQGRTFPRNYAWIQSSDLPKNTSIVLAIADVPVLNSHLTGCIAIVSLDGQEYRFATYQNVRILQYKKNCIKISQGGMTLHVSVLDTNNHKLQVPNQGTMQRSIEESLASTARFMLTQHGKTLLDCISNNTSYEFVS